jgi:hypothetical protein
MEQASAFEHPVDDCLGEILVVKHRAPRGERLVGREDHRAFALVPIVDDVEEHVGRVGAVGEVSDLVDHQDVRVGKAREGAAQNVSAVALEQLVQLMHVAHPQARAPVRELGEVLQGGPPQSEQMLALEVALGAPTGDGGDELRAVLGEHGMRARFQLPRMLGLERPATMRTRSRYRNRVPAMPIASGGIE